jgi:hypothetical protein
VTSLSGSSRIKTGVAESTVGDDCGSTTGEVHGLQVAQQVQGGGNQGGSVGAGSDNGFSNSNKIVGLS